VSREKSRRQKREMREKRVSIADQRGEQMTEKGNERMAYSDI
jgi:hypothetical protein